MLSMAVYHHISLDKSQEKMETLHFFPENLIWCFLWLNRCYVSWLLPYRVPHLKISKNIWLYRLKVAHITQVLWIQKSFHTWDVFWILKFVCIFTCPLQFSIKTPAFEKFCFGIIYFWLFYNKTPCIKEQSA